MQKQIDSHYDVIILGGGLAGLSCADELLRITKSKSSVLVLEKNRYVGGLSATLKKNKFLFDLAPHRWFTKNEELDRWIDDLMKDELVWVKKNTPMYQHGKFYKYPVEVFDVLLKVGIMRSIIMLITFIWTRITNLIMNKKIKTMKDAYINRFGYALYKWFNVEYNEKLWGKGGCEKMSADFVDQRVKNLSMISAIKNALGIGKDKVVSLTPRFRFPKKGIGRISDNLQKRITRNKGKILLEVEIVKIKKNKRKYVVYTNKGIYSADHVVSSIPLDELVRIFGNDTNKNILKAASDLSYIHQKIVTLFFNKPRLTKFTWVYVHPKNIKFFRFLETNNWSKAMSPKGNTSIVFEYPYQENDIIAKMKDDELVEITIRDFARYFSPTVNRKNIIGSEVIYVNKAYPKYDFYYKKALEKIKKYFKLNLSNLQYIGRNGMFHYNNMDHSVYTGILAARNIANGRYIYNLDNVNNEAEYLEEK